MIQSNINEAKEEYEKTQQKIRKFKNLQYAAGSWNCKRRIIVKIEHFENHIKKTISVFYVHKFALFFKV